MLKIGKYTLAITFFFFWGFALFSLTIVFLQIFFKLKHCSSLAYGGAGGLSLEFWTLRHQSLFCITVILWTLTPSCSFLNAPVLCSLVIFFSSSFFFNTKFGLFDGRDCILVLSMTQIAGNKCLLNEPNSVLSFSKPFILC